ncbi:MAG: rRNA pseudouridine synthase [Acidobacteriota bacterium]|nr:rRNA pseudouridine synthase [Acidobacteriota bacterium]MDH3785285.1 rRNA pseudouridine synthase [Acidobacteriota bacterium]
MKQRLNKALAHAGLSSRRGADRLIDEGRVTVNGEVVQDLGRQVDLDTDAVKVDGRRIGAAPSTPLYLILNKPREVVTSLSDPEGRRTVADLMRGVGRRVYPVGRLDYHSDGLILMTDDGELARDLMHPRSSVPKVYRIKVRGVPQQQDLDRIQKGMILDGRRTLPAAVRLLRKERNSWLEIVLHEGRNRQLRRMMASIGHPISRLTRIALGGVRLGDLPTGAFRELSAAEVSRLRRSVVPKGASKQPSGKPPRDTPHRRN